MSKKYRWYKVFDSEEEALNAFPEKRVVKVMMGEKYICFTRIGKTFHAFEDKCPHQGKPLVHGECRDDGTVVCPYHQYKFDLNSGQGHGLYLPLFPVEVRDDGVFVGKERGFLDFF